jgi:hypothetical protein
MASRSKKKTTMAKLSRESRLRERRQDKAAKKEARKQAALHPPEPLGEALPDNPDASVDEDAAERDVERVGQ